jgi:Flp pilus assembly protein CpaB
MSITTTTNKKKLFDGRKMWLVFAGLASVAVAILAFTIMSGVTATQSYWVLGKDVPARTQVTTDILTEVVTSAGKVPPTALDINMITTGESYTKYSLKAGDILTESNTGDLLTLSEGLPKDFVIASFVADPSTAAGGNVNRGDYIDIIVTADDVNVTGSEGTASSFVLQHILVIDATVDLDSYSADESAATTTTADGTVAEESVSGNTADSALRSGIPTLFTVGLTQQNAAILAVATKYEMFVVLSSADASDGNINLNPGTASVPSMWGTAPDAGAETDNTFGQGETAGEAVTKPTETEKPSAPSTPAPAATDDATNNDSTDAPVDEDVPVED